MTGFEICESLQSVMGEFVSMLVPRVHVLRDACQSTEEGSEFRDFKRLRVGRKNDILIVHLHLVRQEVTGWIRKAHRVNDRHGRTLHFRTINAKSLSQLARFAPEEEHRAWIGLQVKQPTGGRYPFGERHTPS